ncbi:MAG: four helix bundle protein [Bacteroidota bacterium]
MQHNFRELNIWKSSIELVKMVYLLTKELPSEEKFGLISQINRCSVSIPSNIAEGTGKSSEKELMHFLNIAISSSYELETQLILVKDIFNIKIDELIEKINTLQKMINGFKKKLNKI